MREEGDGMNVVIVLPIERVLDVNADDEMKR